MFAVAFDEEVPISPWSETPLSSPTELSVPDRPGGVAEGCDRSCIGGMLVHGYFVHRRLVCSCDRKDFTSSSSLRICAVVCERVFPDSRVVMSLNEVREDARTL